MARWLSARPVLPVASTAPPPTVRSLASVGPHALGRHTMTAHTTGRAPCWELGTGNRRGTSRVLEVEKLPSAPRGRGDAGEATSAVSWRPGAVHRKEKIPCGIIRIPHPSSTTACPVVPPHLPLRQRQRRRRHAHRLACVASCAC